MQLDKITKLGRYFLAIPMIVFGIQHFLYTEFVVGLIPIWIPATLFWTYFSGVALIAAGIGILFNIWSTLAATLLGLMIFTWVILLHIPRALADPENSSEFINIFDALIMGAGAILLARSYTAGPYVEKITSLGAKVSSVLMICSVMFFGIEHLIHGKLVFIVGAAPFAIPGEPFWVYLSGFVFIVAAIGMSLSARSSSIAALLGIFIFLITLLFYIPQVLTSVFWDHALSTMLKGVAMSGSAFIYSRFRSAQKREIFEPGIFAKQS